MTDTLPVRARIGWGVAALIVAAALLPAAAASAAEETKPDQQGVAPAEPVPGGFRTWEDLSEAQTRLNTAADDILSVSSPGYAGTIAAPENGELQIYWKGQVPADAQERAARTGVPVRFLPARFSEAELAAEVDRLGADPRVATAAPNVDGSGLAVSVTSDADRDAIVAQAAVPLTVTVERKPDLLFDRQNDVSPYWGGARWTNLSTGGGCSTGFSVNWAGAPRMLTAGHCGSNGNTVRIGNATQPNTTITADVNARDTQLLNRPVNRTFAGRIYTGAWNSSSSIRVGGSAVDYVGNWICTGGSYSGEHCNAKVYAVNTSVLGMAPMTYAAKVPGVPAAGNCVAAPGDSGGPVYSHGLFINKWPNFEIAALARGTITAGYLDTPCLSQGVWKTGSYRVFYAPVRRPFFGPYVGSLTFYGATLM
ncbi:S1 family peptidase [Catellatospora sp. KI3]|uniref:S1 family peptidase n=1 Tax=Catellatospora sp. KI3 TaxID=3041620 RepID=UPI002483084F|nr:S1 family peptidase [Catellatospora sp. KI3]MDI1463268.1 S1 family peptidase [Catellatospora sp. KI3]